MNEPVNNAVCNREGRLRSRSIRRAFALAVCLFAFMTVLSAFTQSAFAQTTVTGPPVPAGPSTGTLVASALETVGYYTQAQVLTELATMLERLGALIYVCCIMSALISVSVNGRYDVALWLLVGPPLFFFLIKPSANAAGAEWQMGAFKDTAGRREKLLQGSGITLGEGQQVSWFFHGFNVLVSDTIRQLVGIITDEDIRKPMKFMARQQILDDMFRSSVNKPDILGLANIVVKECSDEMGAARIIALGQRDPQYRNSAEYKEAVVEYCEKYANEKHRVPIPPGPARDYIIDLQRLDPNLTVTGDNLSSMTCHQLWDAMIVGVRQIAKDQHGTALNQRVPPDAAQAIVDEIDNDIAQKLKTPADTDVQAPPFQCAGGQGGSNVTATDGKEQIQLIFTAWMLRKIFTNDPRGKMISQFADHAGIELQPMNFTNNFSREAAQEMVRRFRVDRLAETTRYEAYAFAMTLPYIQGVGLYALATLFPFFALMVLVPGQAGAFFMWCALWVWLKSWDLGWALVMVADEVLWSVMPHSSFFRVGTNGGITATDPITVYEAAFRGDYSYNLATYYMLLSAMLTAVPVLSANAVLGSKKAIAGVLVDGLKSMASNLSTHVGDQIPVEQLRGVDLRREASGGAQTVMGQLVPHHVDMLMQNNQFQFGGLAQQRGLKVQGNLIDSNTDEFIENATNQFIGEWGEKYSSTYNLEKHRAEIKDKIRSEVRAHLNDAKQFTSKNRFVEMANAEVYVTDANGKHVHNADGSDKTQQLGWIGATVETFRQAGMTPEAIEGLMRDTMHVNTPEVIQMIHSNGAEFKNQALNDPMKTHYRDVTDAQGHVIDEYQYSRRRVEALRASGDNFQGMAEVLQNTGLVSGMTTPGFGALAAMGSVVQLQQSESLYQAGLAMEVNAAAMSAVLVQRMGNEYYYQSGQNQEWLFWEQVRAGVSLREEWWNVPDMPMDNRASAVLLGEKAKGEALKYSAAAIGETPFNLIPGGAVVKP